jgi:sorting nexin-8
MGRKRALPAALPLLDEPLLVAELENADVKGDHVKKIYSWVLQNPDLPISELDYARLNIPRRAAPVLEKFALTTSTVVKMEESALDHTVKMLVRLHDGKEVEAVIINHLGNPFASGASARFVGERATLCLSSQVGCAMACQFCATGTLGLDGNLFAGEILEQMLHARRVRPDITNIVFMGMGEPLDNYDAVVAAVRGLTAPYLFGLPHRGITVSTVGVAHRIAQLARDCPSVKLAFSLHAPNQTLREEIVPSAKAFPLDTIMAQVRAYGSRKQNEGKKQGLVMIEYVMLEGVNDQLRHAEEMGKLLDGMNVVVNLIPYNPFPGAPRDFGTPSADAVNAFIAALSAHGHKVFERRHHGRDINAACGQLAKANREADGNRQCDDLEACVPGAEASQVRRQVHRTPIRLSREEKLSQRGAPLALATMAFAATAIAAVLVVARRR